MPQQAQHRQQHGVKHAWLLERRAVGDLIEEEAPFIALQNVGKVLFRCALKRDSSSVAMRNQAIHDSLEQDHVVSSKRSRDPQPLEPSR
jgi:hypothetical protein